jgi:hypothetical protein
VIPEELSSLLAESDALIEKAADLIRQSHELIAKGQKLREETSAHVDQMHSFKPDSTQESNSEISVQDD